MAAGAVLLLGGGCDNGPSAVQTRDRAGEAGAVLTAAALGGPAQAEAAGAGPGGGATAEKGVVTANRRETADAKIVRLYERNGSAFGARSAEDYAARMKAFADHPPAGADTAKRPNGDTLYYQASTNTFAVVARDGTPRTMFKPDDGPAYWTQQKERAPNFGVQRTAARTAGEGAGT
ncbi:S-type pyocin family protein [Brevundimonas goettingensis]|uniref:S-type pyocin family protein n=1 Tax=Brevundimonas goettingensis TaxID=2774190 RepID=A0A975C6K6_9CAUL|nr:S-type pyocin family protein [Brevundimonas goettingensis]